MQYEVQLNASIDDVLNVWVRRWASHRDCKGYPSLQSFMRESAKPIIRYTISELDERTYVRIDEAVKVLHDRNLEVYQVLMAKFLQRQDKKEICTAMAISPRTFDSKLSEGRMFMEGAVFGSRIVGVKL